MKRTAATLFALFTTLAAAQQNDAPNAVLLVAKPQLSDPNFRQTVVVVTQTQDFSTVGVILNRPTKAELSRFLRRSPPHAYADHVYFGGPVMQGVVVALFESSEPPGAPAFQLLHGVYLSMHPDNIDALLAGGKGRYRLYVGFAGWAPGQLESEIGRDSWYVLPASPTHLFRKDTSGMWDELIEEARGALRTGAPPEPESGDASRNKTALYSFACDSCMR
jgi:putative transcriptional regulator